MYQPSIQIKTSFKIARGPAKNAGRQSGELRKQDFSVVQRNVKIVVFQEAG
jgi:hypothetical protein